MTGPALAAFLILSFAVLGIVAAVAVFVIWVAFLGSGNGQGPGGFGMPAPDLDPGGVSVPVITRRDMRLAA